MSETESMTATVIDRQEVRRITIELSSAPLVGTRHGVAIEPELMILTYTRSSRGWERKARVYGYAVDNDRRRLQADYSVRREYPRWVAELSDQHHPDRGGPVV